MRFDWNKNENEIERKVKWDWNKMKLNKMKKNWLDLIDWFDLSAKFWSTLQFFGGYYSINKKIST